jgi:hypothetical protein
MTVTRGCCDSYDEEGGNQRERERERENEGGTERERESEMHTQRVKFRLFT